MPFLQIFKNEQGRQESPSSKFFGEDSKRLDWNLLKTAVSEQGPHPPTKFRVTNRKPGRLAMYYPDRCNSSLTRPIHESGCVDDRPCGTVHYSLFHV